MMGIISQQINDQAPQEMPAGGTDAGAGMGSGMSADEGSDNSDMLANAGPGAESIYAQIDRMKRSLDMNVPDARKDSYERLKVAGLKFFYNEKSHEAALNQLNSMNGGSPANRMAKGVMAYLMFLSQQSKGRFPWEVAPIAGSYFLLELIDFMGKSSGNQPTREYIAEAMLDFQKQIFDKLGITKEHIAQAQAAKKFAPQQDGQPQGAPPDVPERPAAQGIMQRAM